MKQNPLNTMPNNDYKIMTELNNAVFRKISSACAARFRR